jgi:arsenate reductase (thioredoxin)
MSKPRVLFLCIHNSARSQMAEAYLKQFGGEQFEVESAGLEPGVLNPLAIEVMAEEDIDISKNPTKDVFSLHEQGKSFNYVITVCDAKNSERCPVFPGMHSKLAWDFEDPSELGGTHDEKLEKTRAIRDIIKVSVIEFVDKYGKAADKYND